MALIWELLSHVSLKSSAVLLILLFVLYRVALRIHENNKLSKLGVRGYRVPTWMPLGLDFVYKAVKATMDYKNLELWRSIMEDNNVWTTEVRILGTRIVFTSDPENIKAILASQFSDYGKGDTFREEWSDFLGDSIFTTDGDLWHNSRQMLRPQFIRDRVSDLQCFESHVQTLFKTIANGGPLNGENQVVDMAAGNGRKVEMSDLFFRYTLDVITDFLLGKDVQSMTTLRQPFADAFNEVQRVQNLIARAGPAKAIIPLRSFRAGLKVMNEFISQYIDLALQLSPEELSSKTKGDSGFTFLHELASFTRDPKVIRDQLVAVLLAGRDTTASTLSWTLYELGRHPEVLVRLRTEIISVVGLDRTPTYEDLKNMKYLQTVMNETLRLYPAVPFNVRLALHDTTLPRGGGPDGSLPLPVLKNTPVGYSTLMMQRRRDLYPPASADFPDPEVFAPERWGRWQPKPWLYIPFNGGPRICIGQQFALAEMGYVLVRMFQRFDRLESYMDEIDGGNPTLKAEIVLQPGDGVTVALWEAKKSA